jgi:hypothetical protein
MKERRRQDPCLKHLVFDVISLSCITHAACAWSGFKNNELKERIPAFLWRMDKNGFGMNLNNFQEIANGYDLNLY